MPEPLTTRDEEPLWPPQLTAWERATNLPLFALALVFLVAYAVPILYPDAPAWTDAVAWLVNLAVWVLFAVDYVVRLVLAGKGKRRRFVYKHPLDLVMVLLPMVRPLRVMRMALLLVEVFSRHARTSARIMATAYITGITAMILLLSSLAILEAERGMQDSQINDFGDALWWSVVTTSTVGYGDEVPQTANGRIIAGILMFAAIGLVGLVSGSLASWFVDRVTAQEQTRGKAESTELRERLAVLERQVSEMHEVLVQGVPAQRDGERAATPGSTSRELPARRASSGRRAPCRQRGSRRPR